MPNNPLISPQQSTDPAMQTPLRGQGSPMDALVPIIQAISDVVAPSAPISEDAATREREERKEEESVQYILSNDQKKEIVEYAIKCVDDCVANRAEWKSTLDECINILYEGKRPPKSDPWPNCSNISVMAVPTHCNLMHSKLFPAVWNENLTYWQPVSKDDVENVANVRKFMEWVVRKELKLADMVDDILHDLIVYGTIVLKVRWGTEYRYIRDKEHLGKYKKIAHQKAVVDTIPIENIYLPWLWKGEDDSEFIAHDSFMRLPDIKALRARKIFDCSDEDIAAIQAKIEGTMDTDGGDKTKNEGTQKFDVNINSAPIRLIEIYTQWLINGELVDSAFVVDYNSRTFLSGKPVTAISPIGRRPMIVGQFIRRTNRPYGIGLPEIMRGLAKELDAIHNQRIDAGSIAIAPFFFYRAASSIKPDKIHIGPGVGIPVDDIKDVLFAQFPSNFMTSFQEERIIIEYVEKLTSTSAYQMGRESDIVKSRATASGTLALISQGEQAYTLLGLRVQRVISRMLTKILQAYQCFMPTGFADRIIGDNAGNLLFPDGLTPEEIDGGYDCYMLLDSTAGNKAMERQTNMVMVQMAPNLLTLAQSPRGYEIAREFLISIGKIDVEKYLGPKPKQEPGTPGGIPMGPGSAGGIAPATF
jgi:hypothetical protein